MRRKQQGVTLLELMLALVIATAVFILGIRLFAEYSFRLHESQLEANVEQLFQAMTHYYQANCRRQLDANSNAQSTGSLDPAVIGNQATVPLNITTDLQQPGFLVNWRPLNPLVNDAASGQGYSVQFNRAMTGGRDPAMSVYACTGTGDPPACISNTGGVLLDSTQAPPSGYLFNPYRPTRVVVWRQQVTVRLSSSLSAAEVTQIRNDLSAVSGGGNDLVWVRATTFVSPNATSDLWATNPYVKQFNRQYTNDGMAMMAGVPNETTDPATLRTWYNPENYLCGG